MRRLAPSERRLVAVGLLVAAVALVWLVVVSPVIGGFAARAQDRAALLQAYQRNRRLLDGIAVWKRTLADQRRSAAGYAVVAASADAAQDELKQAAAQAITDAGGSVSATQALQADLPAGWVGVRIDAQLALEPLRATLRRLEDGDPHVVVEYLSIGADRAATTGHAGPLDVRVELSAPFTLAHGPGA